MGHTPSWTVAMRTLMNITEDAAVAATTLYFTWPDYAMFFVMLAVSASIGIYFGCCGTRQKTAAEYLLGGKTMSIFPVAVSLVASHVSGVTILGVPSEVYTYGTQYWMVCVSSALIGPVVCYVYIPVLHKLQLTSIYQYLSIRFGNSVRLIASVLFMVSLVLYVPIVIYLPALAFSQVSGVNLHMITPLVSSVCIFYTMLGGLKAVVWTDLIQQIIMMGATVFVIIIGVIKVGGLGNMWDINTQGQRIEFFNLDPSPYARLTLLTTVVGSTFTWLSHCGVSQAMMQRFLSVPTMSAARWTMAVFTLGMILCKSLSCVTGLLIHAHYHACDPLTSQAISRQDQLLPYYVMDIAGQIPGLSGLFVAGVFSAALSTMSTCLNTLSGTIFEDLVSPCLPQSVIDKKASLIMKITVFTMGILCVLMVLVIERLGGVIQMTISLGSITYGAQLGLFSLGMLCPWANTKGALAGGLAGLIVVATMVIGSQSAIAAQQLVYPKKPMSVGGCVGAGMNMTHVVQRAASSVHQPAAAEVFPLFRISFMYFNMIGCFIVVVVGLAVSMLTGPRKPEDVDRDLLSPVIYRWLPQQKQKQKQPLLFYK